MLLVITAGAQTIRLILVLTERHRVWSLSWQRLRLLLQVRETMRLVPVVGVLIRKALKDFEVKGYHIPKAGYCVASDCVKG